MKESKVKMKRSMLILTLFIAFIGTLSANTCGNGGKGGPGNPRKEHVAKANAKKNAKAARWGKRRARSAHGDMTMIRCTPGQTRKAWRNSK